MARIAGTTCGWETGDITEMGSAVSSVGTGSIVTSNPTPPSGNYAFQVTWASSGTAGVHYYRSVSMGANLTELWIRDRLIVSATSGDASANNNLAVWRLLDSGGTQVGHVVLDAPTGTVRYYRGGTLTSLGTLVASATGVWSNDGVTAFLLELRLIPTTGATGTVEIWINGTQITSVTSVQTSGGLANVATVLVGGGRIGTLGSNGVAKITHDDFAVNDTSGSLNNGRPGNNKIVWLPADGAGASSQWTPFTGVNYTNVDDTGDLSTGTGDYVSTNTTAQVDDYTCANLPSGAATVAVVVPMIYAVNPDAGATQIKVGAISGGTTSAGSAQSPGASYSYLRNKMETDPDTSAAWTPSGVNSAKIRIESA